LTTVIGISQKSANSRKAWQCFSLGLGLKALANSAAAAAELVILIKVDYIP
jgi:hypothetical protein